MVMKEINTLYYFYSNGPNFSYLNEFIQNSFVTIEILSYDSNILKSSFAVWFLKWKSESKSRNSM